MRVAFLFLICLFPYAFAIDTHSFHLNYPYPSTSNCFNFLMSGSPKTHSKTSKMTEDELKEVRGYLKPFIEDAITLRLRIDLKDAIWDITQGGESIVFSIHKAGLKSFAIKIPKPPKNKKYNDTGIAWEKDRAEYSRETIIRNTLLKFQSGAYHNLDLNTPNGIIPCLLMPHYKMDFRTYIDTQPKPDTPLKTLETLKSILKPVSELHRKGMVHGDLKPANFFRFSEDIWHLGDLGNCRRHADLKNTTLLTFPYASKHKLTEAQVDYQQDIFSLMVILMEISVGKSLYQLKLDNSPLPSFVKENTQSPTSQSDFYLTVEPFTREQLSDFNPVIGNLLLRMQNKEIKNATQLLTEVEDLISTLKTK